MIILKSILLGAIQGLTEFIPVSSTGHIVLLGSLLGVETDAGYIVFLHLGTLAALVLYMRKEIIRCLKAFINIFCSLYYNSKKYLLHKDNTSESNYKKIISNNYARIDLMILVTMVPTALLCRVFAPLFEKLFGNVLYSALGFFVSALILLVASFNVAVKKGPKESKLADAFIIGVFQGFASVPGVSLFGMNYSVGHILGFTNKFNKVYSFLLVVPVVFCAALIEVIRGGLDFSSMGVIPCLFGVISSAAVGYFVIGTAVKLLKKLSIRFFSVYCICIGVLSVIIYLR